MSRSARRYLLIPEDLDATVVRAVSLDDDRQEAGLGVRQPELDATAAPRGDLRLTLSGEPEEHVEGTLRVTRSGPVDLARYSWYDAEDDATTSLMFRQSPLVFGKRTDCLRQSATVWHNRPKLVPLRSGGAMLLWLEQSDAPKRASVSVSLTGFPYYSVLDPETDQWSAAAVVPVTLSPAGLAGIDAVQFPDEAGELVMVLAQQGNWTAAPADRRICVYHSLDDGATWYERARLFCQGEQPDVDLVDDDSPISSVAVELLDSGRLVVALRTQKGMWALTSDDRGHSWSTQSLLTWGGVDGIVGGSVALGKARNGVMIALATDPSIPPTVSGGVRSWITPDGVTWTYASLDAYGDIEDGSGCAVVMRPDGWMQAYVSVHAWESAGLGANWRDWLAGRTFGMRDPNLGETVQTLMPGATAAVLSRWLGFHAVETPSRVGYPDAGEYGGFLGIDAIYHRGQVLLAAQVVREEGKFDDTPAPNIASSALMVYRTSFWQPLQEALADTEAVPLAPFFCRGYNRTWDCYDAPSNWGFTLAGGGAGAATIVPGGDEGGYLQIGTSPGTLSFTDLSLPNPNSGIEGVVKACVYVLNGGSRTTDDIALRLSLADGAAARGVVIRFENTGTETNVYAVDRADGTELGDASFAPGRWLEVIFSLSTVGGDTYADVYVRDYDRDGEPDWGRPTFTNLCNVALGAGVYASDELSFGHFVASSAASWWKSVALHRSDEPFTSGGVLNRGGLSYVDNDRNNVQATSGRPFDENDQGVDNYMRTSQATSIPAQWVTRGVHVSARGEATTQGLLTHETGYAYAADNLLRPPVLREWRSVDDGQQVEIVLDAGTDGSFRPDCLAVFGRNCPELTLELADADSWASPPFRYRFGYALDTSVDRYTHLWSHYIGVVALAGWSYACRGNRLTVYDANATVDAAVRGPWRPHQFRSMPTGGPRFYCAFRNDGADVNYVYRIRDNTADTLTFERDVVTGDVQEIAITGGGEITTVTFPFQFSIFSDRFACLMEHKYPTTYTVTGSTPAVVKPNSHVRGYRYARITIPACTHRDEDEQFARLGYVLLGHAAELASPDAKWGWSRSQSSGRDVTYDASGIGNSARRHSPRRELRIDYGYLAPPQEPSRGGNSPEEARPRTKQGWAHWLDVVRRLEVDGVPAALVWEGDRAYGQTGEVVTMTASDPQDLWLARVVDGGTVEHVGFEGRRLNTAVAVNGECIPRPGCEISGVVFREEF